MSSKNFVELQQSKEHRVYMGLGDAVLRLIHVEMMYANNTDPTEFVVKERDLIVAALNQQYQLDLGLDCDRDGIPDTIDAFVEAARTDCCRILPEGDTSRKPKEDFPEPKIRTSRKQIQAELDDIKEPEKVEKPTGFFGNFFKK